MLKRVDIDGQPVHSSVSVIPELFRQNFIEQALAPLATTGYRRAALRTGRVKGAVHARSPNQ
jgi:hypothetical protein